MALARFSRWLANAALVALLCFPLLGLASTDTAAVDNDSIDVIKKFTEDQIDLGPRAISTQQKHTILFSMGVGLLVLIIATALLGLSMALYGKQVFVWHMVCASLTVTLALAHAITAMVWFFPF